MILRRLSNAVRKQDWFTVAVETLIVVFGVFIGLQVNNWNAARVERTIERDTLIRLYADIQESITGQTRDLNFLQQQLDDQQVVLASLDSCSIDLKNDNAFQRGIATIGWLNPPRLFRRTIDEITASGRTDIFTTPEIAEELASVVALVEWRAAWYDPTMIIMNDYRRKIEPNFRYRIDRVIENPFVPNHRGGVDYDIEDICKDKQLANTISAASYATAERLDAYRPILEGYTAFMPNIARELDDRWGVDITKERTTP